mmetsp:Transcript_21920/g.27643  ORF Transcript_21920/g.27643 Transcript_21920/m.27643 type:complete len:311 (-) Transcript_21920:54-986(-)|eukprot:CAMPEP_0203662212 /NCGR_PEP_ID=MMETSP0090-20130426/255_1 /ASSEMBLY_ACC=CAM_ASM_001088 /TAXON_ID=426623 /ORGANISM="Chaetoceros affinis, Strain CCMP159" /LENGTH=310 /DNA_ID=CAMNT_0050524969 /DNA_START=46 /DNA_END=978 /DNA_ORIENTATION=+
MTLLHFILLLTCSLQVIRINAFSTSFSHRCRTIVRVSQSQLLSSSSSASPQSDNNPSASSSSSASADTENETPSETSMGPGDKVRLANNIRPSLNPTVINTISNALLQRSSDKSSFIPSENNPPINIMLDAASLGSKAIQSRAKASTQVQGDEGTFNAEECKLVAGRIVGVLMRLNELEDELIDRVNDVGWVKKYGEYGMFGVCKVELDEGYRPSDIVNIVSASGEDEGEGENIKEADGRIGEVLEKLKDDPLVRMCRAECLYALFLKNVELPSMEKAGQIPADSGSAVSGGIDFMDQEKMEVLFPQGFE